MGGQGQAGPMNITCETVSMGRTNFAGAEYRIFLDSKLADALLARSDRIAALTALGKSFHAMADSTSPAHSCMSLRHPSSIHASGQQGLLRRLQRSEPAEATWGILVTSVMRGSLRTM